MSDQRTCPHCKGTNTFQIYRPEVFEFDSFCRDCDRGFNVGSAPPREASPPPDVFEHLTVDELDRLSIRIGCETEFNRRADMELRRRGYAFDASAARWVKVASDYEGMVVENPALLARAEAEVAAEQPAGSAPAEPLTDEQRLRFHP